MPGSSQDTSFIPKNNTNRRKRTTQRGNIFVLTIISYVTFFAALAAAAGVFFYERYVHGQFQTEVIAMNTEVASFREADMQRVLSFDQRLQKANNRIQSSVSIASLFDALEAATVGSVRFSTFELTRDADTSLIVEAEIRTNSFDSSLFQRGVFERNQVIDAVEIEDLTVADESTESGLVFKNVSFLAKLSVPLTAVPYTPARTTQPAEIPVEEVVFEETVSGESQGGSSEQADAITEPTI